MHEGKTMLRLANYFHRRPWLKAWLIACTVVDVVAVIAFERLQPTATASAALRTWVLVFVCAGINCALWFLLRGFWRSGAIHRGMDTQTIFTGEVGWRRAWGGALRILARSAIVVFAAVLALRGLLRGDQHVGALIAAGGLLVLAATVDLNALMRACGFRQFADPPQPARKLTKAGFWLSLPVIAAGFVLGL